MQLSKDNAKCQLWARSTRVWVATDLCEKRPGSALCPLQLMPCQGTDIPQELEPAGSAQGLAELGSLAGGLCWSNGLKTEVTASTQHRREALPQKPAASSSHLATLQLHDQPPDKKVPVTEW